MRNLRRPKVALPTLTGTGKGARKAEEHQKAKASDPATELAFPEHWNEADVRGALYAMHGWACAYCQCELPRNDRGDVEHFRPKDGGYWWLAYSFENYLLACRVCNSARKSDRFPIVPGEAPVEYVSRGNLANEARLLADPACDPVESWMRVDWMSLTDEGFVKEVPRLRPGSPELARTQATIRFFRLNEDPDLRRPRVRALDKASNALSRHSPEDIAGLRRASSRYKPYGITVRNFLEDARPDLLPSSREEIDWLLEDIDERLDAAHRLLWTGPDEPRHCEKMIRELSWALAVLWKDPPPGTTAAAMEAWLAAKGWKAEVEALSAELG
ncbi:MAG: hypothetical protein ABJE95_20230 [Byssovorax sp.]